MAANTESIRVTGFRQTLFFPLRMRELSTDAMDSVRADLKKSNLWQRREDPLRHLDQSGDKELSAEAYAEFVYFPPHIQDLLYPKSDQKDPSLLLFQRTDLEQLRVQCTPYGAPVIDLTFDVGRCSLYLFPTQGVVVLALDLSLPKTTSAPLSYIMVILEQVRRAYPPFWYSENAPGLMPQTIEWDPKPANSHLSLEQKTAIKWVLDHRRSPIASHWQDMLSPLKLDSAIWEQVSDERLPLMAWIAVDNPECIHRGDWVRLAMLDGPGNDPLPYGANYLKNFESEHCYDAFWAPESHKTTRYLFSGYGMIAVGKSSDVFFNKHISTHMQRQYFQLGLMTHFQLAALQSLSARLSGASQMVSTEAETIQKDVLDFTSRYWFQTLSNHVQGQDLFNRWRSFLKTDRLYEQVLREASEHNAFLNIKADRQSADAALNLNLIATIGLVLGVTSGILGMNVLIGKYDFTEIEIKQASSVLGTISFSTLVAILFMHRQPLSPKIKSVIIITLFLSIASLFAYLESAWIASL